MSWVTSCTKEEFERLIGFVNSFHLPLKFTREISETSITFLDINIFVQDNNLPTGVHTTNPQIRRATYCTHLPTNLMAKSQFRTPNFSGSVDSAAMIQTSTLNTMKCLTSFPNVAILTASCLKHSIVSETSIEIRFRTISLKQ